MDIGDILALCKRRGFIWPSYEIYGGVAGMYDYGPNGTAMKNDIIGSWRRLYLIGEGFVEIDSNTIGPEAVFKASGHLDEFSDAIVTCQGCEQSFRADHLVDGMHPNPDSLSLDELQAVLIENGVVCPDCNGKLSDVGEFNLMFKTVIGPGSGRVGYLRPETAQGIFVNYPNLLWFVRGRLPFGTIQVGKGYRNEISPRQGVIRLREFNMMEAELFIDPKDKTWPRFDDIADQKLSLVPQDGIERTVTVKEAVEEGIIANQALAYFVWLTRRFLVGVGVDPSRLRFRQHLSTEMAHYACDCWDAEVELAIGWTEIVGIADRGCWDLSSHADHSKTDMSFFRKFDEPVEMEVDRIRVNFKSLGPRFKGQAKSIATALEAGDPSDVIDGIITVTVDGVDHKVNSDCFEVIRVRDKVTGERFIPHIIEPSYGLDRIIYTCLEHAYCKDGEGYIALKLAPSVAPIKVGVFPLMGKDGLDDMAQDIDRSLRDLGIRTSYDDSGSIGRRYARMDEVGTPWCVTVDYDSLQDGTVTIRYRDTKEQTRIPSSDVPSRVSTMLREGLLTWADPLSINK